MTESCSGECATRKTPSHFDITLRRALAANSKRKQRETDKGEGWGDKGRETDRFGGDQWANERTTSRLGNRRWKPTAEKRATARATWSSMWTSCADCVWPRKKKWYRFTTTRLCRCHCEYSPAWTSRWVFPARTSSPIIDDTCSRNRRTIVSRRVIISRDGSSKNRNLVYLCALCTASSRVVFLLCSSHLFPSSAARHGLRCETRARTHAARDVTRVYVRVIRACSLSGVCVHEPATRCRWYAAAQSNYRPYRVIDELCAIGIRLYARCFAASLQGPRLCGRSAAIVYPTDL